LPRGSTPVSRPWNARGPVSFADHLGVLTERPRPGKPQVLPEKAQARLIAEACSTAPGGRELSEVDFLCGQKPLWISSQ
jgi:hypothetical protein